jgi:hypothetical protein
VGGRIDAVCRVHCIFDIRVSQRQENQLTTDHQQRTTDF